MSNDQPSIAEWDLTQTNLHRIRRRKYEVAVIPTGAIEAHNLHLPEGQDFLHTTHLARRCCEAAWKESPNIICLPTIPFGVDCNQLDFPMAIHVSQATLDAMLRDIIGSLRRHGIRKIVIFNGHGGNDFTPLVRQIQCDLDVFVFVCNWWTVGKDRYAEIFTKPDDHAGQLETSVGLELYPHLVEADQAGDGKVRPFRFEALRKGWVTTSRSFARLNDHCAAGEPGGATAAAGKAYLDLVCDRVSKFLVNLGKIPIDPYFPHCDSVKKEE
jgi:creatinine amidohydrolase